MAKKRKNTSATKVKRGVGQPQYEPTDKDRAFVKLMSANEYSQDAIADYLGIDRNTLAKHFSKEIKQGKIELDEWAYSGLARKIRAGDLTAIMKHLSVRCWRRDRGGWKEPAVNHRVGGVPDLPPGAELAEIDSMSKLILAVNFIDPDPLIKPTLGAEDVE